MITIIIVCKNAAKYVTDTLESIVLQTNTNFQVVIKDGKSTDKTVDIVEAYCKRLEYNNIKCFIESSEDTGIYDAMNLAVSYASSEWLLFLNAGDSFYDC